MCFVMLNIEARDLVGVFPLFMAPLTEYTGIFSEENKHLEKWESLSRAGTLEGMTMITSVSKLSRARRHT